MKDQRRPVSWTLAHVTAAWAMCVGSGIVWIWVYKLTPGRSSSPPVRWPDSVQLARSGTTLIVTLHPLCSCSEATISELSRVLAGVPETLTVYALFHDFGNDEQGRPVADIKRSALWRRVSSVPHVTALVDRDGHIADRFGAETSGDVMAYSAQGELLFHGGLTPARGHEGDSLGRERLLAVLRGRSPDKRDSLVFGCDLHDPTSQRPEPLPN